MAKGDENATAEMMQKMNADFPILTNVARRLRQLYLKLRLLLCPHVVIEGSHPVVVVVGDLKAFARQSTRTWPCRRYAQELVG